VNNLKRLAMVRGTGFSIPVLKHNKNVALNPT